MTLLTTFTTVTSFWAGLSFLMFFAYPTPEFPTPSFEYHTAFNGVAFGIVSLYCYLFLLSVVAHSHFYCCCTLLFVHPVWICFLICE